MKSKSAKFFSKLFLAILFSFLSLLLISPVYAQPDLGRIDRPPGIPDTGGDVQGYTAGLVRGAISFLVVIGFIAAFVWLVLGGIKFITSGGDPKAIESAKSQITWGIIGLVVILTSYAVLIVVQQFFGTTIISGPFLIPRGS